MDSIVLTTANSKTSENHKLRLELSSDLRLNESVVSLSHLNLYYTWNNFSEQYGNNRFWYLHKPSGTTVRVIIPDGSYSVEDINNFLHLTMTDNNHVNADGTFGINIYANLTYNRVTIRVSADFEVTLHAGIRESLGFEQSQNPLTNGAFNGLNTAKIERVNNVLVHCNLVNNRILYDSSILHAFVPNGSFGSLLNVSPNYPFWRNTRNASFNQIEVWFTNQNNEPLEIEDDILVELQVKQKGVI